LAPSSGARMIAKPAGEPGFRLPPPPPLPGLHEVGDVVEVAAQLKDGQWLTSSIGLMHRRTISAPPPQYGDWVVTLVGVLIIALIAAVAVVWPLRKFARSVDDYVADLSLPPMKESGPREVVSATRALNRLHDRLGTLLRSRTQMLTAVSHDLKTPVTRLRLRAEMLEEGELKQKINSDLDDMEALIGSTLDYFRAGSPGDSATKFELGALVREIVDEAPQWQGCVSVQTGEAVDVTASRPSLRRVLTNLIDNAVKYGGGAEILVSRDAGNALVAIRDRGPGIPEGELEKVFEPFYRVESSRSRETGGSGLGLSIAREIAQACGATIKLRNTLPGLEAMLRLPG
jgi:signal transduction histidine kinase